MHGIYLDRWLIDRNFCMKSPRHFNYFKRQKIIYKRGAMKLIPLHLIKKEDDTLCHVAE